MVELFRSHPASDRIRIYWNILKRTKKILLRRKLENLPHSNQQAVITIGMKCKQSKIGRLHNLYYVGIARHLLKAKIENQNSYL